VWLLIKKYLLAFEIVHVAKKQPASLFTPDAFAKCDLALGHCTGWYSVHSTGPIGPLCKESGVEQCVFWHSSAFSTEIHLYALGDLLNLSVR